MNIIILNDFASIQGGAAQVAILSAIGLAAEGNKVVFVYAAGVADPRLHEFNVETICLNQQELLSYKNKLMAAWDGLWSRKVENQLDLIFRDYDRKNTIVHVHSWVKALTISAVGAVVKSKLPMVLTLHDYFTVCPNGGLYNYTKQIVCHKRPMSMGCLLSNCDSRSYSYKLWRYARQLIYTWHGFPGNVSHYISVSDFSQELLAPFLPIDAKYWRIENPIDIEKAPAFSPQHSRMYTYIGRLSPEKGVLLLTKVKSIPHSSIRFIGDGELVTTLRELMPAAQFAGWCAREQIIDYLHDTRALLFTSQLYETQGLVVAEAASCGVPAIVSDETAAQDFIVNGETGLLFKSGEASSLDEQILRLESSDDLVKDMGASTYARFWYAPPTVERHVTLLLQCYQTIIEEHRPA
jgi:glycosyltransferase involved in cell wall biosynthesis